MSGLRLIVGLGNPGPQYERTRHNAGFDFLHALYKQSDQAWKLDTPRFGHVARWEQHAGQTIWLLRPSTLMNHSGRSVLAAMQFWKVAPEETLIVHDELDLPPGTARLKFNGGHGGQNGLRDIMRVLGHGAFHRLRIGIGHPGHKEKVIAWVLSQASAQDQYAIDTAIAHAMHVLPLALAGDFNEAMKRLHTSAQHST